ncbi:MAG: hypothetical protein AAGM67_22025, partial [Bacteroidota bacterium]
MLAHYLKILTHHRHLTDYDTLTIHINVMLRGVLYMSLRRDIKTMQAEIRMIDDIFAEHAA